MEKENIYRLARREGMREAAEIIRKNIPVLPPDGPSSIEQQVEYETLGYVMSEILSNQLTGDDKGGTP